eukprot:scaffold12064_cov54-Phaeocystis_antarctica.AAC.1
MRRRRAPTARRRHRRRAAARLDPVPDRWIDRWIDPHGWMNRWIDAHAPPPRPRRGRGTTAALLRGLTCPIDKIK